MVPVPGSILEIFSSLFRVVFVKERGSRIHVEIGRVKERGDLNNREEFE